MSTSSWNSKDRELIQWFSSETNLPSKPFHINSAVKVLDPQKFYASLRAEISLGPQGPRSRFGSLQQELMRIREIVCEGTS